MAETFHHDSASFRCVEKIFFNHQSGQEFLILESRVDCLQNQPDTRGLVGDRYPLGPHTTDPVHGPLVGLGRGTARAGGSSS